MKKALGLFFKALGLSLIVLIGYLLFWPINIEPEAWNAPQNQGYQGDFVVNQRLADFEREELDGLHGPEAITQDAQGTFYASTHEGWIMRWNKDDQVTQKWLDVGGRPLGLAFGHNGDLWVANAYLGLMRITPDGDVTIPVTTTNGVKVRYADDVVVASNGKVYFSDATTKFSARDVGDTLAASLLDPVSYTHLRAH